MILIKKILIKRLELNGIYLQYEASENKEEVDEEEGDEENDGIWECRLCYCHATVRVAFTGSNS